MLVSLYTCVYLYYRCLTANQNLLVASGERLGCSIVTDAITTPVVNTSAYFLKKTSELIDFKVCILII